MSDEIEVRHWRDVAWLLLETPGDWYLLEHGPVARRLQMTGRSYRIRNGRSATFRDVLAESGRTGRWESTVRTVQADDPDERVRCYVRFVPE